MTETTITPYLFFGGRCEEALAFYRDALGAETEMLVRFDESPEPAPPGFLPPNYGQKVMHASFRVRGVLLMASDGCGRVPTFDGLRLALAVPTETDARRAFDALAEGGSVQLPLAPTAWSPWYGMVTDRFGLGWMVMVPGSTDAGR